MKAFPTSMNEGYPQIIQGGMDLRDWFAGLAMQAILSRPDARFTTSLGFVGAKSYQYADEMMRAREINE